MSRRNRSIRLRPQWAPVASGDERSLSALSLAVLMALVVYASLYPFEGWRWPGGVAWRDVAVLPWPRWRDRADEWLNLLGYLPVGLLGVTMLLHRRWPVWAACLLAVTGAAALSYSMELLQMLLPNRVPSLRDWAGNSLGAGLGALLAVTLHFTGWLQRWRRWRELWFTRDSAGAVVLLLLWPAALLVPSSLPFGLGQCWDELQALAARILGHLPLSAMGWDADWALWWAPQDRGPLSRPAEVLAMALGCLAPAALSSAASPPGVRRLGLILGAGVLGIAGMSLSTALNFGPQHAMSWLTPPAIMALMLALIMALPLAVLGRRWCAALALPVLAVGVALVAQAPTGAYHALNVQAWEQGRFIRFHGLSMWVAWLWPYAAMLWLLFRLGGNESDRSR